LAILDFNSFKSILEEGWYVYINNATGLRDINDLKKELDSQSLKTFSLVGKFNVGKSFIIKLLSGVFVKTGDTLHTKGIEFYKALGDILFLDVAGEKNPVYDEPGYILDRRLVDYFVEEVVQETSMSHIHVVNRIDNTDQEKLMKLRAR
jgi:ribosome biogenesis GTPase A